MMLRSALHNGPLPTLSSVSSTSQPRQSTHLPWYPAPPDAHIAARATEQHGALSTLGDAAAWRMRSLTHRLCTHLKGAGDYGVVQVEHKQHKHLQRVRGQQAMVRAQQTALVVAPSLDLQCSPGEVRCTAHTQHWRSMTSDQSWRSLTHFGTAEGHAAFRLLTHSKLQA